MPSACQTERDASSSHPPSPQARRAGSPPRYALTNSGCGPCPSNPHSSPNPNPYPYPYPSQAGRACARGGSWGRRSAQCLAGVLPTDPGPDPDPNPDSTPNPPPSSSAQYLAGVYSMLTNPHPHLSPFTLTTNSDPYPYPNPDPDADSNFNPDPNLNLNSARASMSSSFLRVAGLRYNRSC